jgi:lipoprotein-anchoring transpeptidase ErfK/SrfK
LIFSPPKSRLAGISFTLPGAIVMVAVAAFVVSATEVAVTVTLASAGTVAGAAKVAAFPVPVVDGSMLPQAVEQSTPFCVNVQVTPWRLESLPTVAVNGVAFRAAVAPTGIIALAGDSARVMAGIVRLRPTAWFGSETEVATRVTFIVLAGGFAGAE